MRMVRRIRYNADHKTLSNLTDDVRTSNDLLNKLVEVLKEFQKFDPEMQIPTMLAYLYPAKTNPIKPLTIKKVANFSHTKQSSASRNVMAYCEVNRAKKPGYHLLRTEENPMFRTEKLIYLTEEGKEFRQRILQILRGEM